MTICKRTLAVVLTVIMLVSFIPASAMAAANGWQQTGSAWRYYENGKMVTGWKKIGKTWYYFRPETGVMVNVPSELINDKWYAFQESGANVTKAGWNKITWLGNELWFYIKKDGTCYTGWIKDGDSFYYLSSTPRYMEKNTRITYLGEEYVLDKNGRSNKTPPKSGWKQYYGKWYYLKNYEMMTGWQTIGGKRYYFNYWGTMAESGSASVDGKRMLFDGNGALVKKTGWVEMDGDWYYVKKGSYCTVGWKRLSGKWYYFDKAGEMCTSLQTIDGKKYYFYSDGSMACNTTIKYGSDTYKVDANGVCTLIT